ncbi:TetR/AcrR family transcriptional regulator [Actinomadura sp. HBU206391]|uniref:TetR/AcrR family transcriptional regulator n=1 Tax=Actinomadura sp. HBU206391 TaxID=2731692 RepID=UPI00164FAFD6|nr:TetR/AcrR family transcriptional regulator [Actinomadura sp. HBU206391]MBC6461350.1 TetR/AcrR family transcriptional regulator [Actinomadura sp. HBU206391]
MPHETEPSTSPARNRILDAADRLFYLNGINATGIDAVIDSAQVARMTFYKHFGGKEGLILAYLDGRDVRWRATLERALEAAGDDPSARLLAVFDALRTWATSESRFRGCSFANAMAELADPGHPARELVTSRKKALRDRMLGLARATGAADPVLLVDRLLFVYEGVIANHALGNVTDAMDKAHATARLLIDDATLSADGDGEPAAPGLPLPDSA